MHNTRHWLQPDTDSNASFAAGWRKLPRTGQLCPFTLLSREALLALTTSMPIVGWHAKVRSQMVMTQPKCGRRYYFLPDVVQFMEEGLHEQHFPALTVVCASELGEHT